MNIPKLSRNLTGAITGAILLSISGTLWMEAQSLMPSDPKDLIKEGKVKFNKNIKIGEPNKVINPFVAREPGLTSPKGEETMISRAGNTEGSLLSEDFQSWNGEDASWLPEGWSRINKTLPDGNPGWMMYQPSFFEEISSTCLVVPQYNQPIDTWVITPEVTVEDGMILSFLTHPTPVYYFDEDYIDWSIYAFTEMHIVNDFRVYVSEDGGNNWELLKSIAAEFENIKGYMDLYNLTKETAYTLDLSNYAGKNIKVGFNVWGIKEGNTAMLDEVSIGYPALNVSYARPDGSLYFGLTSTDQSLPISILAVPAYNDVKFTNTSMDRRADFSWEYETADGDLSVTGQRDLTVTYTPDYSESPSTLNNLYSMPVLKASADKFATTEYSIPALLQAGGNAELEASYTDSNEKELFVFGLSIVDPWIDGTATFADFSVPYFGYNEASDWYWTNVMLAGDPNFTMDDNTYCHLEKYANFFTTPDVPLVISGIRTNAYGILSRNAKLKAEIYLLNDKFEIPEKPYATAECTGDDITIIDRLATNYILTFNFPFDEPVVISKDLTSYFVVAISGFRDAENVEYFSPEMSAYDNADGLALGWIGQDMKFNGAHPPLSWSPVYNNIERLVSFYIMLDAAFPWLEPKSEYVVIGDDGKGSLVLDSFYPAEELTVTGLPEWLTVTGSGRYGATMLEFTSTGNDTDSAVVTISAPGCSKQVKVGGAAGVEDIIDADGNKPVEIYTLTGMKVTGDLTPGIYIFRMADGRTVKRVVR